MHGKFLMGMALGAMAGIVLFETKSEVKQMLMKGKQMIRQKMDSNSSSDCQCQN